MYAETGDLRELNDDLRELNDKEAEAVSGGIIVVGGPDARTWAMLNPQPLPPRWSMLNPQPEPPGLMLVRP
jgi:hypothetical protein